MEQAMKGRSVWYVLHVRPRCEKKMAEYCAHNGVEHYLALRSETKIYQRRRVTVTKPVFTGYVFVCYGEEQRLVVLKSNLIARIIETEDQARLVHEMAQVRQALTVDPTLGAGAAFIAGKFVRVKGGPFQGLEGVVQQHRGATRLLLNVEMIGQAVILEVDRELLEPAE